MHLSSTTLVLITMERVVFSVCLVVSMLSVVKLRVDCANIIKLPGEKKLFKSVNFSQVLLILLELLYLPFLNVSIIRNFVILILYYYNTLSCSLSFFLALSPSLSLTLSLSLCLPVSVSVSVSLALSLSHALSLFLTLRRRCHRELVEPGRLCFAFV